MRGKYVVALIVGVGAAMASVGAHANLVANGGFETGDFTGWNVTGNGISIDAVFPNSGNFDASFSAVAGDSNPGVLSQNLATTAGQAITLSFALLNSASFSLDSFTVSLGGFSVTITGDEAAPPGTTSAGYTIETFLVPGADITGSSTALSLTGQTDPIFGQGWNLDDVSAEPEVVAVPEPSALALFSSLLAVAGGLLILSRRRFS